MADFKFRVTHAFGLAFDVEKSNSSKSGFRPAAIDLGAGKELFGDLRLFGFVAALDTKFTEGLSIMGGDEGRYKGEVPVINRAEAIREMLIKDMNINPDKVAAYPSRSNTGGNLDIIARILNERSYDPAHCCLITNHYHLPRATNMLYEKGLMLRPISAEALWLILAGNDQKNELIKRFGESPLAERDAEEIQGIADMIRGEYKPRTDMQATFSTRNTTLV